MTITFTTEKRRLGDLIPWDKNPRSLSKKSYKDLRNSLMKFGYVELAVINHDNTIIAGHQRTKIARDLWGDDLEIEVRVASANMTPKEFMEYNIRSNANTGEWDWDILANEFDAIELAEWGLEIPDIELQDVEKPHIAEPDDGSNFCERTFILTKVQDEIIKQALDSMEELRMDSLENNENKNSNGNAITEIVMQWQKLKT